MSNKTPKFLLCENPLIDDGRIYIFYNGKTKILAEVFHFNSSQENEWMELQKHFKVGSRTEFNNQLIVIGCHWHTWIEPTQHNADRLAKTMRRMADWYKSILINKNEK